MNDHAGDDVRAFQSNSRGLQSDVRDAAAFTNRVVLETVSSAPLVAVGAAAALGFLIGGGVPRSALVMVLGVGARIAGSWLQNEFLERTEPQE